ncbi:MAG: hypothetical protein PVS3B3_18300 [Ktedonobacteraceae bacterium]
MYQFGTPMQQSICTYCHKPIQGSVLTALGSTWHPEHFVCGACGLPIFDQSFNVHDGKPYHAACFRNQVASRCAYCGKPLIGGYLVDQWGTKFCKEHEGQYPHCTFCGRLISPQQQERNPESMRCPICRATAVETTNEAQPLFRQCIEWVSRQGLKYGNQKLSLELVDRAKLARYLSVHIEPHALGATMSSTYVQDGRVIRTEITGVAVLHGLPASLFQGVTIHELGHVWLIVQGISNLSMWAEEGFCELLSQRFYTEINTPESLYHAHNIERNPDSVYGEGYRRVRDIADKLGFEHFIQHMSTTKQLPS